MRTSAQIRRFGSALFLLAAASAWTPIAAADEKEVPKAIRVLFVGNSQFYYNNLHKIVEALAESAPKDRPRIIADAKPSDRSVAGGATLERHWKFGTEKNTARSKIADEKWDYIILQEFSGYASKESTNQYARLFHDLIRQNGAKTVLFSTAHVADKVPKGFLEINETNGALGKELKVPVVAAGMAWLAYWGDNPTQEQILELYDRDKGHPGPKGSYLYACSVYAFLTGTSPVGLTNRLVHLPEHPITPAEAKRLQEAAWKVHQETNGKHSQARTRPSDDIEREKLSLAGWDPDEPVPAYAYYKKGNKAMPVVIFMHGMGGSKEQDARHMRDMAGKGFFVLAIDAFLHGERKVPGVFRPGGKMGDLGEDYPIWVHQSSVSHTARDVSKIIDSLSARADVDASRVGVIGISMGSSMCMVLAWKEPRISVVVGFIGAVDFRYDVTKTAPGPEQDAKWKALSPRVRQLVESIDPRERKAAIAPKAVFLANGARDKGIDIESIKTFVKDLQPGYRDTPDRLKFLEEPEAGHSVTDRMWKEGSEWLLRHLVEKPIRLSP